MGKEVLFSIPTRTEEGVRQGKGKDKQRNFVCTDGPPIVPCAKAPADKSKEDIKT